MRNKFENTKSKQEQQKWALRWRQISDNPCPGACHVSVMVRELEPTGVLLALALAVPIASVARVDKGHSPSTRWPPELLPEKAGSSFFRGPVLLLGWDWNVPCSYLLQPQCMGESFDQRSWQLLWAGLITATASNPLIFLAPVGAAGTWGHIAPTSNTSGEFCVTFPP